MKIFAFLLLIMISGCLHAQSKIIAHISNIRNDNGVCQVCLFNNASAFSGDSGAPVKCEQTPVKNGMSEALFENVPPGAYAVMVFHDANNNKKLDKNFLGIPKEGYGASKNKLPFASAPNFNDNKFIVTNNVPISLIINLRNL